MQLELKSPKKVSPSSLTRSKARREMIESSGRLFQLLGLPRSTGQIFGLLYLSNQPLALDDVADMLTISRGSVSMGLRQLAGWTAIRQVWIPGERKDYFEASSDLATLLKKAYSDFVKPRLNNSEKRVSTILLDLERDEKEGLLSKEEYEFCLQRMKSIARLQKKISTFAPLAEKFLG